jgi:hypothetical protein
MHVQYRKRCILVQALAIIIVLHAMIYSLSRTHC